MNTAAINESETLDLAHWAICYHTNSHSDRAARWYYIGRVIKVDGRWWCLYRHPQFINSARSRAAVRENALNADLALLHGVFTDPEGPHAVSEVHWSLEPSKAHP